MHISQVDDEELALLLEKCDKEEKKDVLLDETQVVLALPNDRKEKQTESNLWYLDNGASNHMTGCKAKFSELNEEMTRMVRSGDSSTVEIKGKGSITFKCKTWEERILHEVYYIPELRSNIISLGKMSEKGNRVILKGNYLWIFDKNERMLMKVKRSQNRLYRILIETAKSKCLLSRTDEVARLWHVRLGHVNYKAMELMSKEHMVEGLPRISVNNGVCDGCLMTKQTRRHFPSQRKYSANNVLELVHADLCGPSHPRLLEISISSCSLMTIVGTCGCTC